jgi:hypothetical protein
VRVVVRACDVMVVQWLRRLRLLPRARTALTTVRGSVRLHRPRHFFARASAAVAASVAAHPRCRRVARPVTSASRRLLRVRRQGQRRGRVPAGRYMLRVLRLRGCGRLLLRLRPRRRGCGPRATCRRQADHRRRGDAAAAAATAKAFLRPPHIVWPAGSPAVDASPAGFAWRWLSTHPAPRSTTPPSSVTTHHLSAPGACV